MLIPETAEALNVLLEEERAGVQCTVAFASGATEYTEREAFTLMGREDLEICLALRERLAQAEVPISPAASAVAEAILAAERYDERLRAFAEHQRAVSRRAAELAGEVSDAEAREILERLADLHGWHARWSEQRADDFAATRLWENGRKPRQARGAEASPGPLVAGTDAAPPASGADGRGSGSADTRGSEIQPPPDGHNGSFG